MYEGALSRRWSTTSQESCITGRTVLEAFFLHSLILEAERQGRALSLPHRQSQEHRLTTALNERNVRVASDGLVHWAHRCNDCFKRVMDTSDGEICEQHHHE